MFPLTAALAGSRAKLQIIESVRGGGQSKAKIERLSSIPRRLRWFIMPEPNPL